MMGGAGSVTLVGYPADYRQSGIMTFAVSKDGRVYEKDLGPNTAKLAPVLKARTGSGWHIVAPATTAANSRP